MSKKVAVLAVNPVNGSGLFQYLEAFYENGIPYEVFAVADTKEIKTNSGIALTVNDTIARLKGCEEDFDALVFACGDAMPVFAQNAEKAYNQELIAVIRAFGERGKTIAGHCLAALLFEKAGIAAGRRVAIHPLAKPAVQNALATDREAEVDGNFYTAQNENTISALLPSLIGALK
jgi:putative intracellular protease/amidase